MKSPQSTLLRALRAVRAVSVAPSPLPRILFSKQPLTPTMRPFSDTLEDCDHVDNAATRATRIEFALAADRGLASRNISATQASAGGRAAA